jgi:hypothetical protein
LKITNTVSPTVYAVYLHNAFDVLDSTHTPYLHFDIAAYMSEQLLQKVVLFHLYVYQTFVCTAYISMYVGSP